MSQNKIFVCKECGAMCDHDEITYEDICFECKDWEDLNGEWLYSISLQAD